MADWAWVAAGFGVAYGAVTGYLLWLHRRWVGIRSRGGGSR